MLLAVIFAVIVLNVTSSSLTDHSAAIFPQVGAVQEYCHMETFQPRCTHGDVISMTTAMFGRMRVGRCIESDALQLQHPDSLGCSADVLGYFDRVCSGKSSCDVLVPNPDLYSYRPCSAHLSMYLEASYVCVTLVDEDRSCSISATLGTSIFIASSPNNQQSGHSSRCGSRSNPWIVEAQTGQQISVRLLDFGQHQLQLQTDDRFKSRNPVAERSDNCSWHYGYIKDKAAAVATGSKNVTLCATGLGFNRDRFIYSSKGSAIEVVVAPPQDGSDSMQHKFLLGFQAVGCSNLMPPGDAWLRRVDNEATIGCYTTRQRWHLRCHDGQWKGTIGQCADAAADSEDSTSEKSLMATGMSLETNMYMRTLVIVAVSFIGLAVCLVIVFIGIGCSRRYQRQLFKVKNSQYPEALLAQHKIIEDGSHQINENTSFRSTTGIHQ